VSEFTTNYKQMKCRQNTTNQLRTQRATIVDTRRLTIETPTL